MNTQRFRLAADRVPAARINRERVIGFSFNGRRYYGHPGDTLASALLANGVSLVGRSFKYHRPRGILGAGAEEPNALVQLDEGDRTLPNHQATQVELYEGLKATSVNAWPSLEFDLLSINQLAHRMIPAGFYYKTFMWPGSWWEKVYEPWIRKSAGLGHCPTEPDPDTYDKMNLHVDVCVVGGGPAGLAAALAASRAGARVLLVEQDTDLGGQLLYEKLEIDDQPALDWVQAAEQELRDNEDVTMLTRTTAVGYYDHNFIACVEKRMFEGQVADPAPGITRERMWRVRAAQVVLATGSLERPMVFRDNDRPGIMLASAVRQYVNRYGVAPGNKAVLLTNNDDAYRTVLDLVEAGVDIAAVIDVRLDCGGDLVNQVRGLGIEVIEGWGITGVHGSRHVSGVEISELSMDGTSVIGQLRSIPCDLVCVSGGWNPVVHLHSHSGGKNVFEDERGIFLPGPTVQSEQVAGSANGDFALQDCLEAGAIAGRQAAIDSGYKKQSRKKKPVATNPVDEDPWRPLWVLPSTVPVGQKGKHFIDFQNDVTAADVRLAAREGYVSVEHAKRYTTMGMATDQGKTGNIPGMATLAQAVGKEIAKVGTTTFRPPYTPTTFGAFAGRDVGRLADVVRRTPMDQWHENRNCVWEDVGQWRRPRYYPKPGETMQQALDRECRAARTAVAMLDASTLGKIDIQGPDAAEFLNRLYTNRWDKLKVGRCRYGLMLHDDGMIFDDGVTTRIGENHFHMTTTTGGAANVLAWMEEWLQTEWPDLKVYCTSVTEQWAVLSLSGPKARKLLAEFTDDIDLSPEALPFMSMAEGTIGGIPGRIFRISFTGESSFEVNIPASAGYDLWSRLMTAGKRYGITPYGTEAMHVLRAEKGFIIVGQETDGTVTPVDLGMSWIMPAGKGDFIGRRALARDDLRRADRKHLVGLKPINPDDVPAEGGQITEILGAPPLPMLGHVTSSYYSANLGRSICLGLVKGGREKIGQQVYVHADGTVHTCEICDPVFYDPEGERTRA